VRSHHDLDAQGEASLRALRRLCSLLGCELHVIEGDDVVQVVREFCAERGTTYLLTGRPHDSRLVERLREPLPVRLVRALDGVDVRIVADRVWRGPQEDEP
jgi:two-component system sensor histidine kinase KdpD